MCLPGPAPSRALGYPLFNHCPPHRHCQVLGPDHSDTVTAATNLALVLQVMRLMVILLS